MKLKTCQKCESFVSIIYKSDKFKSLKKLFIDDFIGNESLAYILNNHLFFASIEYYHNFDGSIKISLGQTPIELTSSTRLHPISSLRWPKKIGEIG
ncbi:hypothetical protein BpHYR1_012261 [Brachionus plicatilis]|uniref:Uncharacterized protein n=1 Tax=Brachionus plicatilis TaxID=10195 RepID=A0A3M7S9F4_BRAPC|nr:hypothetical protein BpHYR1_012261 [Brachionus plicatilis]